MKNQLLKVPSCLKPTLSLNRTLQNTASLRENLLNRNMNRTKVNRMQKNKKKVRAKMETIPIKPSKTQ